MRKGKCYLGDSVYVARPNHGDDMLVLTTENGGLPNNTIYLEPKVFEALLAYADVEKREVKCPTA